jgi:hypothetical protein
MCYNKIVKCKIKEGVIVVSDNISYKNYGNFLIISKPVRSLVKRQK